MFTFKFRPVFASDTSIAATEFPAADNSDQTLDEAAKEFLATTGNSEAPQAGHNQPPMVLGSTSYVPRAKDLEELDREAARVREEVLEYAQRGETNITAELASLFADIVFLGTPTLRTLFSEAQDVGLRFSTIDQKNDVWDAILQEGKRRIGADAWREPIVKTTANGAIKRAMLLAYGYAKIAYFKLTPKKNIDTRTTGIDPEDMPQFDPKQYARAVAVPFKYLCPVLYDVAPHPKNMGEFISVAGSGKVNNDDKTLYYISTDLANLLYDAWLVHHGERLDSYFTMDERGFIKGRKRTPQQVEEAKALAKADTEGNEAVEPIGEKLEATKPNDPTELVGNPFYVMRDFAANAPSYEGNEGSADSACFGFLRGLRIGLDNDKPVKNVFLAEIGKLAVDALDRILRDDSIPKTYGMLKPFAELAESLMEHCQFVEDGDNITYTPEDGSKAMTVTKPVVKETETAK